MSFLRHSAVTSFFFVAADATVGHFVHFCCGEYHFIIEPNEDDVTGKYFSVAVLTFKWLALAWQFP